MRQLTVADEVALALAVAVPPFSAQAVACAAGQDSPSAGSCECLA